MPRPDAYLLAVDHQLAVLRDVLLAPGCQLLAVADALPERRAEPLEDLASALQRSCAVLSALFRATLETADLAVELPDFESAFEPAIETLRREAQFCREGI